MNPKRTDPAAGRLGALSGAAGSSLPGGEPRKSNYGTDRLGLVLEADEEPARPEGSDRTGALQDAPAAPSQALDGLAAQPPDEHPTAEAGGEKPQAAAGSNRRRIVLLAGGGLAAVAAALAVVALWAGGPDETTPQMASASPGTSAPSRQPAAVHESKAQRHAPREASPKPQAHSPEQTASAEAGPSPQERPAPARPKPRSAGARRGGSLSKMILARALRMLARRPQPARPVPAGGLVPPSPVLQAPPAPPRAATPEKRPAPAPKVPPPELKLSGIMRGPDGRMAILNGQFVSEGSVVNRARVVRIGEFSVEAEYRGQRFVVGVSPAAPRRTQPGPAARAEGNSAPSEQADH